MTIVCSVQRHDDFNVIYYISISISFIYFVSISQSKRTLIKYNNDYIMYAVYLKRQSGLLCVCSMLVTIINARR